MSEPSPAEFSSTEATQLAMPVWTSKAVDAASSKKSLWRQILILALSVFVGVIIGVLLMILFGDPILSAVRTTKFGFWVLIFGTPVIYFLAVLFHEIGHVVGGWIAGFKFRLLLVGPIKLERKSTGLKFSLNKTVNLGGGLAMMLPSSFENLKNRILFYFVGGPLASVVLSIFSLAFLYILPAWSIWRLIAILFVFLSGLLAVQTAIPIRRKGFHTDGGRILSLLSGGSESDAEIALFTAVAMLQSGKRWRELPIELILRSISSWNKPDYKYCAMHQIAYSYWLDQGTPEHARPHMDEILKHIDQFPPGVKPSVWQIPAFFAAFYDRDLEQAKEFRSRFQSSAFTQVAHQHLLTAAIEVLEGNVGEAKKAIEMTRDAILDLMYLGERPYIEDFLMELESRLRH